MSKRLVSVAVLLFACVLLAVGLALIGQGRASAQSDETKEAEAPLPVVQESKKEYAGPDCSNTWVVTTGAITQATTNIGQSCDDCVTTIPLPFAVKLYNQIFSTVNVGSNGNLQFTTAETTFTNACLPITGLGVALMPHWDDLRTTVQTGCAAFPNGCGVFTSVTGTAPNRVFNIEWQATYFSNASQTANFEVKLYENNTNTNTVFHFVYGTVAQFGAGATIGAKNSTGSSTQYSCNQSTIVSGRLLVWTWAGCIATSTPTRTRTRTPTPTGTYAIHTNTPTPTTCPITFSDVQPTDFFYESVRYLYCMGYISGYGDNTFRPFNNTTRGQLSKIIVLAEGWPLYTPPTPTFSDVPTSHTFFAYIETAFLRGIISGYADGTFKPGNDVTRGQLSKIIVLAENWPLINPPKPTFIDVPVANPFFRHVETAFDRGIISGYADGTFRPNTNATRGQICKIVYNAIHSP
jgi:hypothetical protein